MTRGDGLARLSATEIVAGVLAERFSASDVTGAVLREIERCNGAVNAFALIDADGAVAAAEAADAKQAAGEPLGPLHGVPFHVKDLIDTADLETAFGSWLMQDNVPANDAECVRRLKAAGGILIGKTTTPEFAGSVLTQSPRYGVTRNPWELAYTAGGSSGGAAAAVAAGFGPLGLSTDGAGSARIPASCCGVLGLKPTLGRAPHERAPDLFANYSHMGLQARTTADLATMLNVISGPFAGDPWTAGRDFEAVAAPMDPSGALAGRRAVFLPRMGNPKVAADVLAACQSSLECLRAAGLTITIVEDELDWGIETSRVMMRALMSARMAHLGPEARARMDPAMRASIAEGEAIAADAIKAAPMARTMLFRQVERLLDDADLILSPTLSAPPPSADFDPTGVLSIDGEAAGDLRSAWFTYPTPFNLTGHPAMSVPSGRSDQGLPIGLQAVARWGQEQRLIDIARVMETAQPWSGEWPDLP